MTIQFSIYDWRDIVNYVGVAVSRDEGREMLQHIRLRCENNRFEAVGCNGYYLSKLEGKCLMSEGKPVEILMKPVKAPAKTESVIITDIVEGQFVIYFYDKNKEMTGFETIKPCETPYMAVDEKFIKPAVERRSEYTIAVNPQYMLDVLAGMKGCDTVIFECGANYQPIIVHPYRKEGTEIDAMSLVLPVRIF